MGRVDPWVGFGWVGLDRDFSVFGGLDWVGLGPLLLFFIYSAIYRQHTSTQATQSMTLWQ